jgi:hypothetical protein
MPARIFFGSLPFRRPMATRCRSEWCLWAVARYKACSQYIRIFEHVCWVHTPMAYASIDSRIQTLREY